MSHPEQPVRVLLAEDHASLAEATACILGSFGLEVAIAVSGADALRQARTFHPDIVVCDMGLPDQTGIEVARALRAHDDTRHALMVISTALSDADLRFLESKAPNGEVDLFLPKPLTGEVVQQLLAALADRRSSHRPATRLSS